jgi:hypothetical protein
MYVFGSHVSVPLNKKKTQRARICGPSRSRHLTAIFKISHDENSFSSPLIKLIIIQKTVPMAFYLPRAAPRAFAQSLRVSTPLRVQFRPAVATPLFRRFIATPAEQPRLRLGSVAPNFKAKTTQGDIDFHEFIGDSWTILFSHPADFTPVCTTELGAFAKLKDEFESRGVKMIGLVSDACSKKRWCFMLTRIGV